MQRFFLTLSLLGTFSFCDAQKTITTANSDSSILITRDPRLDELVDRQKQVNLEKQSMPGYRVQIYFGGNRPKASEVKLDFNSRFPDIPAYLTYQQPNFKVRVGDFRNRYEAQKLLKQLEGKYPTTFVVPDEVKLPSLR
ncbi:MAG: SPOR domain-containing protein [Bacteroidia bacterium]